MLLVVVLEILNEHPYGLFFGRNIDHLSGSFPPPVEEGSKPFVFLLLQHIKFPTVSFNLNVALVSINESVCYRIPRGDLLFV